MRTAAALMAGVVLAGCGRGSVASINARHLVLVTIDTLRADRLGPLPAVRPEQERDNTVMPEFLWSLSALLGWAWLLCGK